MGLDLGKGALTSDKGDGKQDNQVTKGFENVETGPIKVKEVFDRAK